MKKQVKLMQGDNIESLKQLPDNSIDSVVTDPPYGLSFMNKKWDYDVPSVKFWKEVYRVLKPGGHVLSFGGTRTYHRMVVNMEDAGFEIRDQIMWLYGSGFPKSRNIGKDIEKINVGGLNNLKQIGTKKGTVATNHHELATKEKPKGFSYKTASHTLSHSEVATARTQTTGDIPVYEINNEYEGWGTALKPANEPICLARKPLSEKSVAENVLKWGTGGINVDGCRVGSEGGTMKVDINKDSDTLFEGGRHNSGKVQELNEGRFPANLILECICDEVIKGEKGEKTPANYERTYNDNNSTYIVNSVKSGEHYNDKGDIHTNPDCPCRLLDEQSGTLKSGDGKSGTHKINRNGNTDGVCKMDMGKSNEAIHYGDSGGASRFFYQAKVSKSERNMGLDGFEEKQTRIDANYQNEKAAAKYQAIKAPAKNNHPTVKPVNLMTYLCRLITPKGGIVLDPFMGSGSTGIAAQLEGFRFVGMEMDEEYMKIATARIENYEKYKKFIK